jgi:hypothetical protein
MIFSYALCGTPSIDCAEAGAQEPAVGDREHRGSDVTSRQPSSRQFA